QGCREEALDLGEVLVREVLHPPPGPGGEGLQELAPAASKARREDGLELDRGVGEPDRRDAGEGDELPPLRGEEEGEGPDDGPRGPVDGPLEGEEDILRGGKPLEGREIREVPEVHEAAGVAGEELGHRREDDGGGPLARA